MGLGKTSVFRKAVTSELLLIEVSSDHLEDTVSLGHCSRCLEGKLLALVSQLTFFLFFFFF